MGSRGENSRRFLFNCSLVAGCLVGVVEMELAVSLNEVRGRRPEPVQSKARFPLVSIQGLSVTYKDCFALEGISGTFHKGTLTAVIGPNGGGKSTFLKTLMGLIKPEEGSLTFHEIGLKKIAYLPQQSEIDRSFPLTVRDAIALGLCPREGFFSRFDKSILGRVDQALQRVGLPSCGKRSLHTLSGGQLQRVLFARLIVQDADLILLDEPFNAVDPYTIEDLMRLIVAWQKEGRTVVVVSHDIDLVREFFPETLLIARKLLGWGRTEEVVTLDLLRDAKKLSRTWETCVELCQSKTKFF